MICLLLDCCVRVLLCMQHDAARLRCLHRHCGLRSGEAGRPTQLVHISCGHFCDISEAEAASDAPHEGRVGRFQSSKFHTELVGHLVAGRVVVPARLACFLGQICPACISQLSLGVGSGSCPWHSAWDFSPHMLALLCFQAPLGPIPSAECSFEQKHWQHVRSAGLRNETNCNCK